ncbi:hypothetical protein LTR22_027691, partial [Elasticomyces elasticus]
ILPNTTSDIDPSLYLFPHVCGNGQLNATVPGYAIAVQEPDKTISLLMTGNYNATGAFAWHMKNATFSGNYNDPIPYKAKLGNTDNFTT